MYQAVELQTNEEVPDEVLNELKEYAKTQGITDVRVDISPDEKPNEKWRSLKSRNNIPVEENVNTQVLDPETFEPVMKRANIYANYICRVECEQDHYTLKKVSKNFVAQ